MSKTLTNVKIESNVKLEDSTEHLDWWKVRVLENAQLKVTSRASCTGFSSADKTIFNSPLQIK